MESVVADRDECRSVGMSKTGCQAAGLVSAIVAAVALGVVCVSAGAQTAAARSAAVSPVPQAKTNGVVSSGPQATTLPPDLVSLEQKMRELDVNTERVSLRFTFPGLADAINKLKSSGSGRSHGKRRRSTGNHRSRRIGERRRQAHRSRSIGDRGVRALVAAASKAVPTITGTGEVSLEPREATFDFAGPHGERVEERQIGEDLYVRVPGLAKLSGGRRWELQSTAGLKQAGLGFGTVGESAQKGMFGELIEVLEGASSVSEVGPATVDGQETTEFVARLSVSTLLKRLPRTGGIQHKAERRARKALERLGLELKVFVEPDGLPVRTKLVLGVKRRVETVAANILAVGVPVEVAVPPSAEVITEAELKARLEAAAKRREARMRRKRRTRARRRRHG